MMQDANPKTGWRILEEQGLLIGTDYQSQVQTWIVETMSTFKIDPGLTDRMLGSALEAISRTEGTNLQEPDRSAVHLRLYIPLDVAMESGEKRNWGFFRIDQLSGTSPESDQVHHLIEFFLYPDS